MDSSTSTGAPSSTGDSSLAARSSRSRWAILAGAALLAATFPPIDWGLMGWIALLPWSLLVAWERPLSRSDYVWLWAASAAFWLWELEAVRNAHPALYLGWFALSAYLAVYAPAFVGLARTLVHQGRWPVALAVPVAWTALEYARGHLLTGFSVASLGHSQAEFPLALWPARYAGAYGVSFVLAMTAASLAVAWTACERSRVVWPSLALGAVCPGIVWGVGVFSVRDVPATSERTVRVCVVQGALDVVFETSRERDVEVLTHYRDLTRQAIATISEGDPPTLYVWPESSFPIPQMAAMPEAPAPKGFDGTAADFQRYVVWRQEIHDQTLRTLLGQLDLPGERPRYLLVGGARYLQTTAGPPRVTNEAVLVDRDGAVVSAYAKCHPVMFGEYIPFAAWFPWIYEIAPLPGGITAGEGAKPFVVDGVRFSPSICFESTVPHVIARHVRECRARDEEIDCLVNITNDGWFWGGAVLDLQAQCNVLRAVEHDRPMIVAANTGLSLIVLGNGVTPFRAPRRKAMTHDAQVSIPREQVVTFYSRFGDWFAAGCVTAVLVAAINNWVARGRASMPNVAKTPNKGGTAAE